MGIPIPLAAAIVLAASLWHTTERVWAAPIGPLPSNNPSSSAAESSLSDQVPELEKAITAFRQNDLPDALRWLEEAHQRRRELAPAEVLLANMLFSEDQPERGREVLEQAAVKHPTDPEPHLIFGDLAFRQRRFSDAQVQYERGRQLTTTFAGSSKRQRELEIRALAGMASVAEARGQFPAAHELLSALLKLEPQHPQAHFRLGNVLFALSRPEEALAEFQAAAAVFEAAPSPMLTLAELYRQAGNIDQAERWISRAIQESPDDLRAQLTMARWLLDVHNDPQAALPFVDRAAQINPDSPEVPLLRGVIAWCQGDHAQAEQIFESLALKQPSNTQASNYLAAVLAEQNDADRRQRAWEMVQLTAANSPHTVENAATVGWVSYHVGELERAEQELQRATAADGAGRDARYYSARTLFRRGEIAKAQRALQQALEADGPFIHLREARQWQRELGEPGK